MLVVWPIAMAYHEAVEGEDVRMGLVTLLFLFWSLAVAGSARNFPRWKQLGVGSRIGVIILGIMSLGLAPGVFGYLWILGPSIIEVYSILLGTSN